MLTMVDLALSDHMSIKVSVRSAKDDEQTSSKIDLALLDHVELNVIVLHGPSAQPRQHATFENK